MAEVVKTTSKLEMPLADVPFDEMIASMGTGIAEAQRRLDEISFEITKMMSGTDPKHRIKLGEGENAPTYSLLDLGFTPTFYQFVDTTLEVKVAFSMNSSTTSTAGVSQQKAVTTKSTPVDATYANRFQYPVEGSSVLRTKLVTVPPPGLLESRVRELRQNAPFDEKNLAGETGTTHAQGAGHAGSSEKSADQA